MAGLQARQQLTEVLEDIPSPIDLKDPLQALRWVQDTVERRPYRLDFFRAFARYLREHLSEPSRVLEIGSGPGHLASRLLADVPRIAEYTLLDFSDAMHALAQQELRAHSAVTRYVTADFRDEAAFATLEGVDVIVTMQAVHELRHKRHVGLLYRRLANILRPAGYLLVCDHTTDNAHSANAALFMTREEQQLALIEAGFIQVERLWDYAGITLHSARTPQRLTSAMDLT